MYLRLQRCSLAREAPRFVRLYPVWLVPPSGHHYFKPFSDIVMCERF
jgi:hypothetical protein